VHEDVFDLIILATAKVPTPRRISPCKRLIIPEELSRKRGLPDSFRLELSNTFSSPYGEPIQEKQGDEKRGF
jgi:hypothetical protein